VINIPIDEALEKLEIKEEYKYPIIKCSIIFDMDDKDLAFLVERHKQSTLVSKCPMFKKRHPFDKGMVTTGKYLDPRYALVECPDYLRCSERQEQVRMPNAD
jgi:hypothetical protein